MHQRLFLEEIIPLMLCQVGKIHCGDAIALLTALALVLQGSGLIRLGLLFLRGQKRLRLERVEFE